MATTTELTLALGRTAYGGDPEDDEKIQSREVRVSLTWRLTEDEQDLPLTVSVLAEEAQRALDQADRVVQRATPASQATPSFQTNGGAGSGYVPPTPPPANSHDQTFGNGNGQSGSGVTAPRYGGYAAPQRKTETQTTGTPSGAPAPVADRPYPGARHQPITAPQRLAIRSLCARQEVSDTELTRLLDQRFGKRRLEDLSKTDAAALLEALQRGAWEDETETRVFAN